MADIVGTSGNDALQGTSEADLITGLGGNDQVFAGTGNDRIEGGAGDDYLNGEDGNDTLIGGEGRDGLFGGNGDDILRDDSGSSELIGGAGADLIDARGAEGSVIYTHFSSLDASADIFADADVVIGSSGNDLIGAGYNDSIDGGAGEDYLNLNLRGATAGLMMDFTALASGGSIANGTGTIQGVERIYWITGSDFDDTIVTFSVNAGFPPSGMKLDGAGGNDHLTAGDAYDSVSGGTGSDIVRGGAGNDSLTGGVSGYGGYPSVDDGFEQDSLFGEAGDDILYGGIGDLLDGGTGQDRMVLYLVGATQGVTIDMAQMSSAQGQALLGGTISNVEGMEGLWLPHFDNHVSLAGQVIDQQSGNFNTFYGGNAVDTLIGSDYGDRFDGQGGNDQLAGLAGNDSLYGGAGDDLLDGGEGNDGLFGGDGIDQLTGGGGFDNLEGGNGDDFLTGGAGRDTLLGGGGIDTASYADQVVGITAHLTPTSQAEFDASEDILASIEVVIGSAHDDIIGGNQFGNRLLGSAGNDLLFGKGGDDDLDGGIGADSMLGGSGNDSYYVDDAGDAVVEAFGEGTDSVGTSLDYYLGTNVEWLLIFDGAGDRYGVGNELDNAMVGNEGSNLLIGHGGVDILIGAAGNDILFGGEGGDGLFGDDGIDYLAGGVGDDLADGGNGSDEIWGEAGDDTLIGGHSFDFDILVGGEGQDTLIGNSLLGDFDYLYGNGGDDTFFVDTPADLVFEQLAEGTDTVYAEIAGAGYYLYDNIENLILVGATPFGVGNGLDNQMTGSEGDNYLLGGGGNDTLYGGLGNDVLFGEGGADVFVFEAGTGGDVIGDFAVGADRIDLSGIFTSFAQAQASFVQNGNVGAINLGNGDLVVLHDVTMNQLSATDFIFG